MAYVPEQEENKQNVAAPQANGGAAPTTGGGNGGGGTGTSTQGTAPQSGNQGFANINQYIGANADQAPAVAGTVASNLNNQSTTLQNQATEGVTQAQNDITAGSHPYDQGFVQGALANPTQFVADPNNVAKFQSQYGATYTGPQNFESSAKYGQVADAANKAGQTYGLGQTSGGYSQLLNQIEKNPTAGRTALDKALIQSDPNAQNTIQGALTPFKGIQDYVSGKSAELGAQANKALTDTQAAPGQVRDAYTTANNANDTAFGTAKNTASDRVNQVGSAAAGIFNTFFPGELNFTPEDVQQKTGLTPGQYETVRNEAANQLGYTPQEGIDNPVYWQPDVAADYAKQKALRQLLG